MYRLRAHPVKWLIFLFTLTLLIQGCEGTPVSPGEAGTGGVSLVVTASPAIEKVEPVPSEAQLEWQDAELVMFIHFGMNTFTGRDVGDGSEDPALFNPGGLDVR